MIPAIVRGSTRFVLIPQTAYNCVTRQEWVKQAPIEFGGIKLTDAEDPGYLGVSGYNDKVLDYEDVRGSILCRLNVRQVSQTPAIHHFTFSALSQFSGKEIGRLRVRPTNC